MNICEGLVLPYASCRDGGRGVSIVKGRDVRHARLDERHVQNGSVLRVTEIISVQARGRDSRLSGFESRVVGDRN